MDSVNADETKRIKAKNLRYKKPIAKGLTFDAIREALWEIMDSCADVRYYVEENDETLHRSSKRNFLSLLPTWTRRELSILIISIPQCFVLH